MAIIKSGNSTDQLTVDPTSKAARTTLYDSSGNLITPASNHITATDFESVRLTDGTSFYKATTPADTQPISGTITANAGTGIFQTDGVSEGLTGLAVPTEATLIGLNKGGILVAANADSNGNLSVNISDVAGNAATTKGVQPAAAIPTQDLKDSGRVIKIFQGVFTPATTETMVSLTPVTDGTPGTAAVSFAVTAGKRFRIQAFLLAVTNTTAAIRGTEVTLRMTATGAVVATSPIIGAVGTTTVAATLNLSNSQAQSFPDGVELSGAMQFGVSANGTALAGSTVTIIGYEY